MYFIDRDGQHYGPYAWELLQSLASSHELRESDLIWTDPMPSWQPAGTIAGLFSRPAVAVAEAERVVVADPEPLDTPAEVLSFNASRPEVVSTVSRSRKKWMQIAAVALVSTMIAVYAWMNNIRNATIRARDQRNEQMTRSNNAIKAMEQQMLQLNQRRGSTPDIDELTPQQLRQVPFGR